MSFEYPYIKVKQVLYYLSKANLFYGKSTKLREAFKKSKVLNLGHLPNLIRTPPPPHKLGLLYDFDSLF